MKRFVLRIVAIAVLVLSMGFIGCSKEEQEITVYGTISVNSNPKQGATVTIDVGGKKRPA